MKVVCAQSVLLGKQAFADFGDVQILPDRNITREDLLDADALIVRSQTPVTAELLRGTRVQFAATATAGSDHMQVPALGGMGICMHAAVGSNANAVVEAVLGMMAHFALNTSTPLAGRTLGIIGCGHIGGRLAEKAGLLGLRVLKNDPPIAHANPSSKSFISLEDVLAQSDIITLHVPLTATGLFPTRNMAGYRFFNQIRPGAWFFNASRGGVVDLQALAHTLECRRLSASWLDVWEKEPHLPPAFPADIPAFTPHIAGYSYEGLLEGTLSCRRALCRFLEKDDDWRPAPEDLPAPPPIWDIPTHGRNEDEILMQIIQAAAQLPAEAATWQQQRAGLDPPQLTTLFDQTRRRLFRREFSARRIRLPQASAALLQTLAALDFQVIASPSE